MQIFSLRCSYLIGAFTAYICLLFLLLPAEANFSCVQLNLNQRGSGLHTLKNNCPTWVCVNAYYRGNDVGKLAVCAKGCGEGYISDNPGAGYWHTGQTDQVTYSSLCTGRKAPSGSDSTKNNHKEKLSPSERMAQIEQDLSKKKAKTSEAIGDDANAIAEEIIPVAKNYLKPRINNKDRAQNILNNTKVIDGKIVTALRNIKLKTVRAGLKRAATYPTVDQCKSACSRERSLWSGDSDSRDWDLKCTKGCLDAEKKREAASYRNRAQAGLNRSWVKRNYLSCRSSCSSASANWQLYDNKTKIRWAAACEKGCYNRANKRARQRKVNKINRARRNIRRANIRRANIRRANIRRARRNFRRARTYSNQYRSYKYPTITPFRLRSYSGSSGSSGGGSGGSRCPASHTSCK